MLKLLKFVLIVSTISASAAAEPVIVMRPAIGTGSAGVIPQSAFATTSQPTNPSPAIPDGESADGYVFKSGDYLRGQIKPWKKLVSNYDKDFDEWQRTQVLVNDFPNPLVSCEIDRSATNQRAEDSFVEIQTYERSKGAAIALRPLVEGKMALRLICHPRKPGEYAFIFDVELSTQR